MSQPPRLLPAPCHHSSGVPLPLRCIIDFHFPPAARLLVISRCVVSIVFNLIPFGLFSLGNAMWPSSASLSSAGQQHQPSAQLQPHRIRASLKEERLMAQVAELTEELQIIKSEHDHIIQRAPLTQC